MDRGLLQITRLKERRGDKRSLDAVYYPPGPIFQMTGRLFRSRHDDYNINIYIYACRPRPQHTGSKFHLYNDDFTLHPLPNTGHCPMDERPLETLEILRPFLARVYGG